MKKFHEILQTDLGALTLLIIGVPAIYILVGVILGLTLGPWFGAVPIVLGIGSFLGLVASIKVSSNKNEISKIEKKHCNINNDILEDEENSLEKEKQKECSNKVIQDTISSDLNHKLVNDSKKDNNKVLVKKM